MTLLRAGLLCLAVFLCALSPARASEDCRPLEAVLAEATTMAEAGASLFLWREDDAARAMASLRASHGEPPRPHAPDLVILLVGPHAAIVIFGEGTQACLILPLRLESAAALHRAVAGGPA